MPVKKFLLLVKTGGGVLKKKKAPFIYKRRNPSKPESSVFIKTNV